MRLLLLEHDLTDVFGVRVLHSHFSLQENEKLVELNHQSTGWNLGSGDGLMDGRVVPKSWRLIKGKGLMPYEFTFRPLNTDRGIDLTEPRYQAFLTDFVAAVEAAELGDSIALSVRPAQPAGIEITMRSSTIFFPEGTYQYDPNKAIVTGWYFNSKSAGICADVPNEKPILRAMCWMEDGGKGKIGREGSM